MKDPASTSLLTSEESRPGRLGNRLIRGVFLLAAAMATLGAVLAALRGLWVEAATIAGVAVPCYWQARRIRKLPKESLSRRLSSQARREIQD